MTMGLLDYFQYKNEHLPVRTKCGARICMAGYQGHLGRGGGEESEALTKLISYENGKLKSFGVLRVPPIWGFYWRKFEHYGLLSKIIWKFWVPFEIFVFIFALGHSWTKNKKNVMATVGDSIHIYPLRFPHETGKFLGRGQPSLKGGGGTAATWCHPWSQQTKFSQMYDSFFISSVPI